MWSNRFAHDSRNKELTRSNEDSTPKRGKHDSHPLLYCMISSMTRQHMSTPKRGVKKPHTLIIRHNHTGFKHHRQDGNDLASPYPSAPNPQETCNWVTTHHAINENILSSPLVHTAQRTRYMTPNRENSHCNHRDHKSPRRPEPQLPRRGRSHRHIILLNIIPVHYFVQLGCGVSRTRVKKLYTSRRTETPSLH